MCIHAPLLCILGTRKDERAARIMDPSALDVAFKDEGDEVQTRVSEDEDGTMQARGEAASKAIRRDFPKLSKAVTRGAIPEELYAQELIGQPMLDIFVNQSFTDQDKGRKIMLEVQKAVEIQPDLFDAFCSILCNETVTKDLAKRLRGWCACTNKTRGSQLYVPCRSVCDQDQINQVIKDLYTRTTSENQRVKNARLQFDL